MKEVGQNRENNMLLLILIFMLREPPSYITFPCTFYAEHCPSLMDDMKQFASLAFFPLEKCGFALIYSSAAFAVSGLAFIIIRCANIM